jgi:DNA-binding NarL/FixJ family response regulator
VLLDDSEADATLIVERLRSSGLEVEARRVTTLDSFRRALTDFRPDLVISDHGLPDCSPVVAVRAAKEVSPTTPFIVVSGHADDRMSVASLREGADDLVAKSALEHLRPAVDRAFERRTGLRSLSPRQVEVLRLIVLGESTPEIARRLGLSVKTIQTHRAELMRRLDIHDISGLVRYAVKVRLLPMNGD